MDSFPVAESTSMLAHNSPVSAKRKLKCTTLSSETRLLRDNPNRFSFRSSSRVTPRRNCSGLSPPPASQRAISCNSPDISWQTWSRSILQMNESRDPARQRAGQKGQRPEREPEEQNDFVPLAEGHGEGTGFVRCLRVSARSFLSLRADCAPFS